MAVRHGLERWTGLLPTMPLGVRIMLTAFLGIIGSGYLVAVANISYTSHLADGKEGMSLDDLRATYRGITVLRGQERPSRMLTMIRTAMREYVTDADFPILQDWLEAGGTAQGLDEGPGTRKTPRRAIIRNCLRCHAQSTGTDISKLSPFGPDEFQVDYAMLAPHVAGVAEEDAEVVRLQPQYQVPRLILISHQHMLAIPMFTLAVALLFMMTRLPGGWRTVLGPLPMVAMVFDFSGWWLARSWSAFVYVIAIAGLVFGLVLGIQVIAVLIDLWRPRRRPAEAD
jgi:hypothetical protein